MKTIFCFISLAIAQPLFAQGTLYVPPRPGNSETYFPFSISTGSNGMRMQQVFGASAFLSIAPNGGYITALTFHFKSDTGGIVSNAQINLSTTSRAVDSLTPVFANNVGSDDQIVLGPGQMNFIVQDPTLVVRLDLASPFFYNPAAGNLLMDIRVWQGFNPQRDGELEAANSVLDSTSWAYAFGADSLSGTVGTVGLVTGFTIDPVPEPSAVALLLTGLGMYVFFHFRKNQTNRKEQ
jgi:hypothetical protein